MLDNEPDTNETAGDGAPASTPAPTTSTAPEATPPAKRPRRRAASRPAGPPTPAAAAPPEPEPTLEPTASPEPEPEPEPEPQPEPEPAASSEPEPVATPAPATSPEPQPERVFIIASDTSLPRSEPTVSTDPATAEAALVDAPPESAPPAKRVRKTAAKRPAKKVAEAAEAVQAVEAPAAAADAEPKARTPRKRASRKTAAPAAETSADDLLAPAEPAVSTPPPSLFSATETSVATPASTSTAPESELFDTEPEPEAQPAPTIDQRLAELAASVAAEPEPEIFSTESVNPVVEGDPSVETDETLIDEPVVGELLQDAVAPEAEDDEDEDDAPEGEQDSHDDDGNRRRRRRRGGRRRRRTGADDDTDAESADSDEPAGSDAKPAAETTDAEGESEGEGDPDGDSETQRRRRRRRRRRGEDSGSSPDDPTEVVVRVREPRRSAKAGNEAKVNNEVTGIEGSTRMEAKRQRRRDGREAGRRRPPILSEAEFLTRRESVSRKMIIRQREDLSQIAVLEDDILVEHYVDRDSAASLIGNVYLGRVQNVLPSMEAAFIDIGRGRNAVLYAGEIDWDSFGAEGHGRKVEKVLKSGQPILVQVSKDPIGAKGARLTNNISMPGRYIVYSPSGHLSGISRKLPDIERKRLRDILADLVGESASVIVRTAAEGASEDELVRDVNRLKAQWEDIERKVAGGSAPQLLYGEPDLTVRIVRDLFTEDFSELIIAGNGGMNDAYDAVDGYVTHVAPHLAERMHRWDGGEEGRDVFAAYRLDEQIAKALEHKVFLPSGGSLVIDRTEAMTVIDVNTGKFTGSGGNLEATVTSNNLEAAEEIVRQLRLRDIGGIIVIDFIDMVLPVNRELLLRRLVECLGRDRTRHQVAEVTSLGLVQMTRKKLGTGLLEAFTSECPHCLGRGVEIHDVPVESQKQADGGTRDSGRSDSGHRESGRGDSGRGGNRRGGGNSNGSGGNGAGGNGGGGHAPVAKPAVPGPSPAAQHVPEQDTPSPLARAVEAVLEPVAQAVGAVVEPIATAARDAAPESVVDADATAESSDTGESSDSAERSPRRRRGSTRGRATREQGAPTVTDPQATAASDPQGELAPSS